MTDFDIWTLPEADYPEVGDTAPDFTRPLVSDEFWENISLSDLLDTPILLVFYPMDGTGVAKHIWIEIRERGWGEGVTVVGASISTPYEHKNFIDQYDLPYQLFSDPENGVAETYGIDRDHHGMTGICGPHPSVFLIDTDRIVRYTWVATEWPEEPDYQEVEMELESI